MPKVRNAALFLATVLTLGACTTTPSASLSASPRELSGTGVVIGLAGTGARDMQTREAIVKLLRKHVPTTTIDNLVMGSAALVALKCERPESATVGKYVDVRCKALGSSTSSHGGQLIMSELCGADGLVYVEVAGPVSLSGFPEEAAAAAIHTPTSATTGWLPKGGVVIRP